MTGHNVETIFELMVLETEGGQISHEDLKDEKVVSEFFLRYNRTSFDYGRKLRCCHI